MFDANSDNLVKDISKGQLGPAPAAIHQKLICVGWMPKIITFVSDRLDDVEK